MSRIHRRDEKGGSRDYRKDEDGDRRLYAAQQIGYLRKLHEGTLTPEDIEEFAKVIKRYFGSNKWVMHLAKPQHLQGMKPTTSRWLELNELD